MPSDCTMSYYFYYADKIGQAGEGSFSRQRRESPPIYPIYYESPASLLDSEAADNKDNEFVQLLNDESALADVASAIGDLRNNSVIPEETMALSIILQAEKEFGAQLYNVHFQFC